MTTPTLEQANVIVQAALGRARALGIKPLGVVVLDSGGHIKAAQREDGASMFRLDVAIGKAWGAVAMGISSRAVAKRAADNPNFINALSATSQGKLLPQPGAVLIYDAAGQLLGAVGASGGTGDEDEAVCQFGVEAAGLRIESQHIP
jgi:uncharacterized protein GlcG (DUF336 family)